jgi:hypothetical protein
VVDDIARSDPARSTGRWLFALALTVYVFTAGGSLTTTDAVVMFDVTEGLVTRRTVALSGNLLGMDAQRGADGRYYSPFGIGQSMYNIPFYLAGRALGDVSPVQIGKRNTLSKAAVALGQTLVAALVVWLTFRFAVAVTGNVAAATMAALTLAFASVLWPYAKFGFNQPLACATLLAAVTDAYVGVRDRAAGRLRLAGVWLSASLLTRHEMMIAAAPIAWWLAVSPAGSWPERVKRIAAFGVPLAAGIAIWLAFNAWRFGNPIDTGLLRDPVPAMGSSLAQGLPGLLFSPAASIFLYSPVAAAGLAGLAALHRRDRTLAGLLALIVLAFTIFYASLGNWIGGRSYGSRYLVVVLPFLAVAWAVWLARVPAARRWRIGLALAVIGAVVQLPGVLVDYAKVSQAAAERAGGFSTAERQWSWPASPIVLNTRAAWTAVPENASYLLGGRRPPPVRAPQGDDDRSFSQQFAFSLDFWWLYLFYMGALSRAAAMGVVAIAVLGVVGCAKRLRASLAARSADAAGR